MHKIIRGVLIFASLLTVSCLCIWFVVPLLLIGWELLFPCYDHKVAVLPCDVECQISSPGGVSKSILLPKGLVVYSPCRHDFSRMSPDETETYKIYLKLNAKTIKSLCKDSDKTQRERFVRMEKFGELTEITSECRLDECSRGSCAERSTDKENE